MRYLRILRRQLAVRIKLKRRKGRYARRIVGKNCKYLVRAGGKAKCSLRNGEYCSKTCECGYEEESRTLDKLREAL